MMQQLPVIIKAENPTCKIKTDRGAVILRKQKPMSFDELLKDLKNEKTIQEDPNHISLDELFDDAFMSKHSSCNSFAEFLEKGNFQVKTQEDINNIPDELFDRHVVRETDFADWNSMLNTATIEHSRK